MQAVYKELLQLTYVEELLELVKLDFVGKVFPQLERKDDLYLTLPSNYDQRFMVLWKKWETETKKQAGAKKMKTFAETSKGKEFQDKKGKPKKKKKGKDDDCVKKVD